MRGGGPTSAIVQVAGGPGSALARSLRRVTDDDDQLRDRCTRFLRTVDGRRPADELAELSAGMQPHGLQRDWYGVGGVVEELEAEVAGLLGKPAAVFMPSGTMAQQIALRVHADDRGRRTVLLHPTAHPVMHEGGAAGRLHDLHLRPVGSAGAPLTTADLDDVAEPAAALLVELPQREIGGTLLTWEELVAQTTWARDRAMAVHMDGARLWECGPFYDRPYDEIAGLFDSVYVSFYKGLGAISGACLAGEEAMVAQAREWRQRHGGTLFGMWPLAASALAGLRLRLDRMAAYRDHAVAIAAAVADLDGVEVRVPPVTAFMHLEVRTTEAAWKAATRALAAEEGIWTWGGSQTTERLEWRRLELHVGDATLGFEPAEVRTLLARLLSTDSSGG